MNTPRDRTGKSRKERLLLGPKQKNQSGLNDLAPKSQTLSIKNSLAKYDQISIRGTDWSNRGECPRILRDRGHSLGDTAPSFPRADARSRKHSGALRAYEVDNDLSSHHPSFSLCSIWRSHRGTDRSVAGTPVKPGQMRALPAHPGPSPPQGAHTKKGGEITRRHLALGHASICSGLYHWLLEIQGIWHIINKRT